MRIYILCTYTAAITVSGRNAYTLERRATRGSVEDISFSPEWLLNSPLEIDLIIWYTHLSTYLVRAIQSVNDSRLFLSISIRSFH